MSRRIAEMFRSAQHDHKGHCHSERKRRIFLRVRDFARISPGKPESGLSALSPFCLRHLAKDAKLRRLICRRSRGVKRSDYPGGFWLLLSVQK